MPKKKEKPPTPHDRLIKSTFSLPANAAGELRAVLPPQLAARIDWSSLRAERGTGVDKKGAAWHTDLLFSAKLGGRKAYIYVLFEHQSSVHRGMPLRVLLYMARIWTSLRESRRGRLPIIIPVVLHHSATGWTAATRLSELLDTDEELLALTRPFVPDFELIVDDLTRVPEMELMQRAMTSLARLVVYALRAVRVGFDPELVRAWAREAERAGAAAGVEAVAQLFGYLSEVDGGAALFQALLDGIESEELREDVMGLRKEWEDKARELGKLEGLATGRAEGRTEGLAEILLKQLRLKFGELPNDTVDCVRRGSIADLERWAERVLTATTLEDVLG